MTRTEELRAQAKVKWPDQRGLYCYVRNSEYEAAFITGVFPRAVALERQAAYQRSISEKFAEVNGDNPPKYGSVPEESTCNRCGRPTRKDNFNTWRHLDDTSSADQHRHERRQKR